MGDPAGSNPLRQSLWPFALLYGVVGAVRNWLFDAGVRRRHRLAVPVVSIGNLTVGGTGKTPMVAWLCEAAHAAGKRPGVLARGYGRAPGAALNDEGMLLQRRLPWLQQEQDPDRVQAGARLLQKGVDLVVLDDGFQHRRLHRDVDVVCLDATLPFGNGHLLPAGDLREFRSGLARAHVLLLTRAGALPEPALAARIARLQEIAGKPLPVFACEHRAESLVLAPAGESVPLSALRGQRVVAWSAIARPAAFRATLQSLGAEVVAEIAHRDHHRFTAAEVDAAQRQAAAAGAWLVTTEKDDARLAAFAQPRHVLRIALQFLGSQPTLREFLP